MTQPTRLVVPALLAALAGPAAAQSVTPTLDAASRVSGTESSMRSQIEEWMIDPRIATEVGGQLRFITARAGLDGEPLRFTDVGLASLAVRHTFGARAEIAAAIDLLAKQPGGLDAAPIQGVSLGVRLALARNWVAWASFAGAPLLGDLGYLAETSLGVEARSRIDRTVAFKGALGLSATPLLLDAGGRPWFAEVVASGQVLLRAPHGEAGMWIGADYRVPLLDRDRGGVELDPQTRLGFNTGVVLGWIPRWDLFAAFAVIDRGDEGAPASQLPVLDGGFDQVQLVFGATRRWERKDVPPAAAALAY
jgi:hypothetical protein